MPDYASYAYDVPELARTRSYASRLLEQTPTDAAAKAVQNLREHGACVLDNVIPPECVDAVREEVEQVTREAMGAMEGKITHAERGSAQPANLLARMPLFREYLAHPVVLDVAHQMLDDHVRMCQINFRSIKGDDGDSKGGVAWAVNHTRHDREWHTWASSHPSPPRGRAYRCCYYAADQTARRRCAQGLAARSERIRRRQRRAQRGRHPTAFSRYADSSLRLSHFVLLCLTTAVRLHRHLHVPLGSLVPVRHRPRVGRHLVCAWLPSIAAQPAWPGGWHHGVSPHPRRAAVRGARYVELPCTSRVPDLTRCVTLLPAGSLFIQDTRTWVRTPPKRFACQPPQTVRLTDFTAANSTRRHAGRLCHARLWSAASPRGGSPPGSSARCASFLHTSTSRVAVSIRSLTQVLALQVPTGGPPLTLEQFESCSAALQPLLRHLCNDVPSNMLQQPVLERAQASVERAAWVRHTILADSR
jgi:hypothetical protein